MLFQRLWVQVARHLVPLGWSCVTRAAGTWQSSVHSLLHLRQSCRAGRAFARNSLPTELPRWQAFAGQVASVSAHVQQALLHVATQRGHLQGGCTPCVPRASLQLLSQVHRLLHAAEGWKADVTLLDRQQHTKTVFVQLQASCDLLEALLAACKIDTALARR